MDTKDLIVSTLEEANEVLDRLKEIMEDSKAVSFSDLCDLVGAKTALSYDFLVWDHFRGAHVIRVTDGFTWSLPKPVQTYATPWRTFD